ncbi:hypothetical protein AB6A40_009813 [Gnathostoma spinigerum]|uniref:Uncharacterized protein n=1 Tax=Gnathostoma spinigerum TaxID=75299 RepID=A0ABD6F0A3_9BILA
MVTPDKLKPLPNLLSYKKRLPLCCRQAEFASFRQKYPHSVPMVVEKHRKEKYLVDLDRLVFIIPERMTAGQIQNVIKKRLGHNVFQMHIYLLINNRFTPPLTLTAAEMAYRYRDEDGFVYITYSSQETFR